jgi:hypothetical protein
MAFVIFLNNHKDLFADSNYHKPKVDFEAIPVAVVTIELENCISALHSIDCQVGLLN